jgi:hypothetical protein
MPSFSSADFLLTILHSNKLPALSLDLALMVTWVFIGDLPIILLHQRLTGKYKQQASSCPIEFRWNEGTGRRT